MLSTEVSVGSGMGWPCRPRASPCLAQVPELPVRPRSRLTATRTEAVLGHVRRRTVRQVTVFAILATPGSKAIDPRLAAIESPVAQGHARSWVQAAHVESKRIGAEQSVTCDLGNGYKAGTSWSSHSTRTARSGSAVRWL